MTRKITALITATLLLVALLPGVALANAATTAQIVLGQQVFPDPVTQNMSIRVTNNESGGFLGIGAGQPVRYVSIVLPSSDGFRNSTQDVAVNNGWQATKTTSSSLHMIEFTGGTIAPGGNFTFPFAVDLGAPLRGDNPGLFRVSVSSDATGQTTRLASDGGLTSILRTLRVESFLPVAPSEALTPQRDMTSGGEVVYRATVRNFAQQAQELDVSVTSNRAEDQVGEPIGDTTISGQNQGAIDVPITVGAPSDRDHLFMFNASSERSTVDPRDDVYRVLAPADITLRSNDFHPQVISTNSPATQRFFIPADKTGTPGLTEFDAVRMQFAGNDIGCDTTGFPRSGSVRELECEGGNLEGSTGEHDVTFVFSGADDNGVPFELERTFERLLRIDNILPSIIFDRIQLPGDQTAGRSGNQVTVSGSVDPGEGGSAVTIDFVQLRSTAGDVVPVNVTRTGNQFSGTATLDFPSAANTDTHTFRAHGQVSDETPTQTGSGDSPSETFDDILPWITLNPATGNLDPSKEARVIRESTYGPNPVIEVVIQESHELRGGCNPDLWQITNNTVTNVLFSNGEPCLGQTASDNDPKDNTRILVLGSTLAEMETPSVEYQPQSQVLFLPPQNRSDRLSDGALNRTVGQVIDTVWEILPPLPTVVSATRNNGTETAVEDEDAFWTRFDGNDLLLTVRGIHTGWNAVVETAAGTTSRQADETGDIEVVVPVGNVPAGSTATIVGEVWFTNHIGAGDREQFTIQVDRILPTIAGAVLASSNSVEVTFSELIWNGDEHSRDFMVWEHRDDPDGLEDRYWYDVQEVSGGRSDTWTLTVDGMRGEPFGGAEYRMVRDTGERLEDRAGNLLQNTME